MLITINNQPADPDLLSRLRSIAATSPPERSAQVDAVLKLRQADSEDAFHRRYLDLLQSSNAIAAVSPQRPGTRHPLWSHLLYPLRKLLWTLLAPSIEQQVWRQNAVNRAMTLALSLPTSGVGSAPPQYPPNTATCDKHRKRPPPAPCVSRAAGVPRVFHRVEQWLAGFAPGDAVSQDALAIRTAFEQLGIPCDLLAPPDAIDQAGAGLCRSLPEHAAPPDDDGILRLYHYSIGSPLTREFLTLKGPRILRYHNITPDTYFTGFDDRLAEQLRQGRDDLKLAAAGADQIWAVSKFNAGELQDANPAGATVLPLFFSPQRFDQPPNPELCNRLRLNNFVNIVFVGRIAPNKNLEDLILAFDHYHRRFNPRSRLLIVGSTRSCPRYYGMLWMLTAALDNRAVCFEDFATDETLATYYQTADLFISPSRHEGYGAPLVEAMAHGIPVIARNTGGVPEAMDGAGILFDHLSPPVLATLIDHILRDSTLRNRMLAAQAERITRWRQRNAAAEIQARLRDGAQLRFSGQDR